MVKDKAKVPCQVFHLEERHVTMRLTDVLGKSAVVGVRKPLPFMSKELDNSGRFFNSNGWFPVK